MLATRSDRSRLLGKTILTFTSSGTANVPTGTNFAPSFLGNRPGAYSILFAKWKINRLILRVLSATGASAGFCAVGILDDTTTSADVPTAPLGVVNLRCSRSLISQTGQIQSSADSIFEWRPLRPSPWFFTTLEGSASDPRIEVPSSIWVVSNSASSTFIVECDYDLSFSGAIDVSSST